MHIAAEQQPLVAVITIASIATVFLLVAAVTQLLRGRLMAVGRSIAVMAVLVLLGTVAALPLAHATFLAAPPI